MPKQAAIRALARTYPHGHRVALHRHRFDQLLYASSGTMSVESDGGTWVIPPQRGVWIPAGIAHRIAMCGEVRMRTLYLAPGQLFSGATRCRVLGINPLEREIILELVRTSGGRRRAQWESLAGVLLGRLTELPVLHLDLIRPRDARAARVARAVIDDPASGSGLDELAAKCGGSARTVARLFLKETGMTFGRWRQQARIHAALRLLAAGHPVTSVAFDVGYESPSAFIAMFRRALGVSPGRYYVGQTPSSSSAR